MPKPKSSKTTPSKFLNVVTDTTAQAEAAVGRAGFFPLAATLGAAGAIEKMEAEGQSEFVASEVLPIRLDLPYGMRGKTNVDTEMTKMGFVLGKPVDDLFRQARLPKGWKKKPAPDHDMWSYVYDQKGRKRLSIFYKAAFYDRSASGRFESRFDVREEYDDRKNKKHVTMQICDGGTVIHSISEEIGVEPKDYMSAEGRAYYQKQTEAQSRLRKQCNEWLQKQGHADFENPFLYW